MRYLMSCLLLLLASAPALADGWTAFQYVELLRVRSDGAILVKAGGSQHHWSFTPVCAHDDAWLIVDATSAQRDLFFEALRTAWAEGRQIRIWWDDACAEVNPGGNLAQLVTTIELD